MGVLEWLLIGCFGLVFGSFGTVLATRVAAGQSIVDPPSACRACGVELRARDLVPVLSFLVRRGRCAYCNARVDRLYPAIELATALLFVVAWSVGGFTPLGLALAGLAVLTPPLVAVDLREQRLPNALTGAGVAWMCGCAVIESMQRGALVPLVTATASRIGAATMLFLLAVASNGGMGMGDVKLAGMIGATGGLTAWTTAVDALGWAFLLGGCIAGFLLLTRHSSRGTAIPFGPMLLAGGWLAFLLDVHVVTGFAAVSP